MREKFIVRNRTDGKEGTEVETSQITVRFPEAMTREQAIVRAKEFMI